MVLTRYNSSCKLSGVILRFAWFLRLEEGLWFSVFFISERPRKWEVPGVNKVFKSCFSEQIRRAEKREWFYCS